MMIYLTKLIEINHFFLKIYIKLENLTAQGMFQSKIFPKSPKNFPGVPAVPAGFRDSVHGLIYLMKEYSKSLVQSSNETYVSLYLYVCYSAWR